MAPTLHHFSHESISNLYNQHQLLSLMDPTVFVHTWKARINDRHEECHSRVNQTILHSQLLGIVNNQMVAAFHNFLNAFLVDDKQKLAERINFAVFR